MTIIVEDYQPVLMEIKSPTGAILKLYDQDLHYMNTESLSRMTKAINLFMVRERIRDEENIRRRV